jgi:hypothetical protein
MIYFIDTEFTDFANMDLISVGIVSEDGNHEFYRENTSHISSWRTPFVNEVVMPLLEGGKYAMSYEWISRDLIQWVAALPDNDVTFVVDYVGDWTLLYKLFKQNADECVQMTITKDGSLLLSERDQSIVKKKLRCQFLNHAFLHMLHERGIHMPQDISKGYAGLMNETPKYFKQDSRQHHALVDAKANRYGWIKGYEAAK